MHLQGGVRRDDVLWLLGSLCGLFRIPSDAALIAQNFPPPYTLGTLHEAARPLGIKTGHGTRPHTDWQTVPLPAIAFLAPEATSPQETVLVTANLGGSDNASPQAPELATILIVKASADRLLYFRPGSQTPEIMPIAEAPQRLAPDLLLVTKEATVGSKADEDIPGFTREKQQFGFGWFTTELLKHKAIWRDVLLASLAIQLVGLVTPLFTQVIIDKVVVHQTRSTLIVLGVALIMFMLFTSGMTWLRQYDLYTHLDALRKDPSFADQIGKLSAEILLRDPAQAEILRTGWFQKASQNDAEGRAYRYALEHLNSFVLTGFT